MSNTCDRLRQRFIKQMHQIATLQDNALRQRIKIDKQTLRMRKFKQENHALAFSQEDLRESFDDMIDEYEEQQRLLKEAQALVLQNHEKIKVLTERLVKANDRMGEIENKLVGGVVV